MEIQDLVGTTSHFNLINIGTTPVSIPSVAGNVISEVLIKTPQQPNTEQCQVSFDGGTNYFELREGEVLVWTLKGEQTQFLVRGASASTDCEIIVNFEDY